MRILVVSPELPYPPAWGFSIRVSQVLSLLAQRHLVTLLAYANPGDDAKVDALCLAIDELRQLVTATAVAPDGVAAKSARRRDN